jgi:hypothetical protein
MIMAIQNRELAAGTILVAKYKGVEHRVLVLGDHETGLGFELDGKTIYKSPSAAGSAVMGGTACNGWRFWSVEGEEQPKAERPTKTERTARTAKPKAEKPKNGTNGRTVTLIRRVPNQKGVADGSIKWFCSACMKGFVAEGTATPGACPEGHGREEADDFGEAREA